MTRSSLVHRVCYDDAKRQMIIELGSTYYAYCDIGSDAVDDLLAAKSIGQTPRHDDQIKLQRRTL